MLVNEEKRRVLISLERDALEWDAREGRCIDLYTDPAVRQGAAAYAAHQADIRRRRRARFECLWGMTASESMVPMDEGLEADDVTVLDEYDEDEADEDEDGDDLLSGLAGGNVSDGDD